MGGPGPDLGLGEAIYTKKHHLLKARGKRWYGNVDLVLLAKSQADKLDPRFGKKTSPLPAALEQVDRGQACTKRTSPFVEEESD